MVSRPFPQPEKPLAQVFADFRDELKEFAALRLEMLREEMSGRLKGLRGALPMLLVGAVALLLALVFLSVAGVALLAWALGGTIGAWTAALAIVGALLLLLGGVALWIGRSRLTMHSLVPERTLRVLRQDRQWLRNEATEKPPYRAPERSRA